MSNLLVLDPTPPEDGLAYIFAYMSGAYGNTFLSMWSHVDPDMVKQVWMNELGSYLKSKAILDHALKNLPPDFPPSAVAFRNLCKTSPDIIDLQTRPGVERLAEKVGMPRWTEREAFHVYRRKVIGAAQERGLL